MIISLIVAVSDNDVIGKENAVPWYLPADLAHFKQTTMGHPIIMGRKTHESIGRALSGRYNVVITHQKNYQAKGCIVVESLERAIDEAKKVQGNDEIFIIGGAEIYNQALPLASRLYLTRVHTKMDGDKFFKFDRSQWHHASTDTHTTDEKNPYDYDFIVLERKK